MTSTSQRFFLNKRFYLHIRNKADCQKAAELIKVFGGQIDQFLDGSISYMLTDVLKSEWQDGTDGNIERAKKAGVKLMSYEDLQIWCSKYITSQSSDDDDEIKATELKAPFLKFEDAKCLYAPTVKELPRWPEVNLKSALPIGKSIFTDSGQLSIKVNKENRVHIKGRQSIYCEICNLKINDRIEDHVETQQHRHNIEKINWGEVNSVIESLPSFSSLNVRRIYSSNDEQHEFLCLHKLETVNTLFEFK